MYLSPGSGDDQPCDTQGSQAMLFGADSRHAQGGSKYDAEEMRVWADLRDFSKLSRLTSKAEPRGGDDSPHGGRDCGGAPGTQSLQTALPTFRLPEIK